MTTPQAYKLGRRAPDHSRPAIRFSSIRKESLIADNFLAAEQVVIPPTQDYFKDIKDWEVLGNDKFGDCVAVTWANERHFVTKMLTNEPKYPSFEQVLQFYRTQNPKFDPQGTEDDNGPNSDSDGGMNIQKALESLVKNGGPDGVKAVAFAKLETDNIEELHQAIAIFGSIWIGMSVFNQNFTELDENKPFTAGTLAQKAGGHSVFAGGYLPNLEIVTWGKLATLDPGFTSGRVGSEKILDEIWVVIWPEHFGRREFLKGVDISKLGAEFERLTGKTMQTYQGNGSE